MKTSIDQICQPIMLKKVFSNKSESNWPVHSKKDLSNYSGRRLYQYNEDDFRLKY